MFKEKLKSLRKENNITQAELADKLFVSRSLIARWEYGDVYPTMENLKKIADYFNVPLDSLLCENEKTELIINNANLERKIKTRLIIAVNALLFIISIVILFIFFPFSQIWGYSHDVIVSTDPLLKVTITEQTYFNIMKDSFYNSGLKVFYSIIFSLEIVFIIVSLISLIYSCINKRKFKLFLTLSCCAVSTILCLCITINFISKMPLNIIGGFFLILSIALLILASIVLTKQRR